MPYFEFEDIKIVGMSSAIPKKIVRTRDYESKFGEKSIKKFIKMTGIEEHRETFEGQTASDLGFIAAENLLKKKEINRKDIGAIIFVSHSPDYRRPATACVLHKRLNLSEDCVAFDINLGCSAFVYGINSICSLMSNSNINNALLICAETISKIVNPEDKSTAMLFGDGGSATLFQKQNGDKISGLLRTDGTGYKSIIAPAGGFRNLNASKELMTWDDGNKRTLYNTNMNGTDVFNFTISKVPETLKDFMDLSDTNINDYDTFALHQANKFIIKQISKKLNFPMNKVPISIDKFGNTSAAAIPLTLSDEYGRINGDKNKKILSCGFGVGLSWGVVSFEISTKDIFSPIETDDYYKEGIINSPEDL